jgi:acetate kinase
MSADMLLTLNAGSSTAKIALFEVAPSGARRVAKGTIDFRKDPPSFRVTEGAMTFDVNLKTDVSDIRGVIAETFTRLANHFDTSRVVGVGHRVVHGGTLSPVRCVSMTQLSKQSIS